MSCPANAMGRAADGWVMPYRAGKADTGVAASRGLWVFAGGFALAAVAAYINVCVLGTFHVPVSHMSGTVSWLSIDLERGDLTDLQMLALIVGPFLAGAALSGVLIGGNRLVPGRRYGVALMLEGCFLIAATLLLLNGRWAGVALAAAACGLQNAMASSYYGLIIRTTHVTGIVTDLGFMIGHWIRFREVEGWKLLLLLTLLGGFFLGGLGGAVTFRRFGAASLGFAAGGCFAAGTIYAAWRHGDAGGRGVG